MTGVQTCALPIYGAPDEVGFVAVLVETLHHPHGIPVDFLSGDWMLGPGDDGFVVWSPGAAGLGVGFFRGHVMLYGWMRFLASGSEKVMVAGGGD